MKSILVPTDFSPAANYVLPLAKELAHKENSRFAMVHSYDGDYTSLLPTYRNFAVRKMNSLIQSNHHTHWPQRCYVREGSMSNCIKQLTKKESISLVVMGKKGTEENTESEIVFGSACSVLAVPQGTLKKMPSHIVYATEKADEEKSCIEMAAHFCTLFNSHLTILNIQDKWIDEKHISEMRNVLFELNSKMVSHEYVTAENLTEGLKVYMQYKQPDIVAVAGASGSWLFNNKRKQYMRKLLAYPDLPLLFINEGTKK